MLADLTLSHARLVRRSICCWMLENRFCVFIPSVSRMITCLVSGGSGGVLSGPPGLSAFQPHTSPMVWLVLPLATIPSTALCSELQLLVSGTNCCGQVPDWSAGKYEPVMPATGAAAFTS